MKLKEINVDGYEKIVDKYHVNSLIGKVIISNNYSDEEISKFFENDFNISFDEKIFGPIKDALLKAKENKEKVFVFGDYDCDGICATTIMVKALNKLNIENGYYIPDRLKEGYGLNLERLQQAYEKGYRVLITVDNGISALEPLKWAKEHNMTIIVTDHHLREKDIDYDYLLHPTLLEKDYQYLSGGAIAYLLTKYLNVADDKMASLACLSIISDAMSLKGCNIKIVNDGLRVLNLHKYQNLELIDRLSYPINENDLSFRIIPKINAIGRLSDIANVNNVVKFLLCDDEKMIYQYVTWMNDINSKRQNLSSQQYEDVYSQIDDKDKIIFVASKNLHDGLIGLIASKLSSNLNKIVFIGSINEDKIKISGRGIGDIDIMRLLDGFKNNFIDIGGHTKACGFSIEANKVEQFRQYLKDASSKIEYQQEFEYINVNDLDLTVDHVKELFKYRPFGQDRKIPLVRYRLTDYDSYTHMKTDHQLKWTKNGIELISFENNGYQYYLNKDIDVIANIKENKFNGKVNYQLSIVSFLE